MSADPLARSWTRAARRRQVEIVLLAGAPVLLVIGALVLRWHGPVAAVLVALVAAGVLALLARRRADRLDRAWLVRALNRARGDLEDSSELFFADPAMLGSLQRLQRGRLQARVDAAPLPDLRSPRPLRALLLAWVLGLAMTAALLAWPDRRAPDRLAPSEDASDAPPGMPHLVGQRLRIVPPGYTGLPARDLDPLDARAPQGSRLIWTLAFSPQPASATLAILGGPSLPLGRTGDRWRGSMMLDTSILYHIVPEGGQVPSRPHRIEGRFFCVTT